MEKMRIDGRQIRPNTIFPWHFHDSVWKALKERLKITIKTETTSGRVVGEKPQKIGENIFKTKSKFVLGSTAVFVNGVRLMRDEDYREGIDGQTITLLGYPPVTEDEIQIDYDKKKNKIFGIF